MQTCSDNGQGVNAKTDKYKRVWLVQMEFQKSACLTTLDALCIIPNVIIYNTICKLNDTVLFPTFRDSRSYIHKDLKQCIQYVYFCFVVIIKNY